MPSSADAVRIAECETGLCGDTAHYIGGVHSNLVDLVWDKVAPLVNKVLRFNPDTTLIHILEDLRNALAQLWVIDDFEGIAITKIEVRPASKVLLVECVAGIDAVEWLHQLDELLTDFARSEGCDYIEFKGRSGWKKYEKAFSSYGNRSVTYRKKILLVD